MESTQALLSCACGQLGGGGAATIEKGGGSVATYPVRRCSVYCTGQKQILPFIRMERMEPSPGLRDHGLLADGVDIVHGDDTRGIGVSSVLSRATPHKVERRKHGRRKQWEVRGTNCQGTEYIVK